MIEEVKVLVLRREIRESFEKEDEESK